MIWETPSCRERPQSFPSHWLETKRLLVVHSNMRLFKGRRKSVSTEAHHDNRSIGSELAIHDQFDILVPESEEKGWRIFESDNSTVSSITTDDHRYGGSHYYSGSDPLTSQFYRSNGASWCCCSGNTDLTEETDNTLLFSRKQNYDSPPTLENQESHPEWRCCGPRVQETQPESLNVDTDNMVRLLGTSDKKDIVSLFDSLSEEDDVDHYKHHKKDHGKRKWHSSLMRKAMVWKKKQKNARAQEDIDLAKESMIPLAAGPMENMTPRNRAAVII
jgi:hypothetical protein